MAHKFKRYIVFQFDEHYPAGGLGDVKGSFNDLKWAKLFIKDSGYYDYTEIIDRDTWLEVKQE